MRHGDGDILMSDKPSAGGRPSDAKIRNGDIRQKLRRAGSFTADDEACTVIKIQFAAPEYELTVRSGMAADPKSGGDISVSLQ
jgi:hypothetical protein